MYIFDESVGIVLVQKLITSIMQNETYDCTVKKNIHDLKAVQFMYVSLYDYFIPGLLNTWSYVEYTRKKTCMTGYTAHIFFTV